MTQPNQGDYVVEPVPGRTRQEQFRVRRHASDGEVDQFLANEESAIKHALTQAVNFNRAVFLHTRDGWLLR